MNEQLQNAVGTLLEKSLTSLDEGIDFLAGELPEVIQQLYVWEISYGIFWSVFSVLVLVIPIKLLQNLYKGSKEKATHWSQDTNGLNVKGAYAVVGSCILILIFTALLFEHLINLSKIYLAPKLWLIEYMAQLTNK